MKVSNRDTGPHLLFNDSMGTMLFAAAGLPVPVCTPLRVTSCIQKHDLAFLDDPDVDTACTRTDLCFGTRFLGGKDIRFFQILPSTRFARIDNRSDFWLAWLLDVYTATTRSRKAVSRWIRRAGSKRPSLVMEECSEGPKGTNPTICRVVDILIDGSIPIYLQNGYSSFVAE